MAKHSIPIPLYLVVGQLLMITSVLAINLDKLDKLTKAEINFLNKDVTKLYETKYDQLDCANVTYDEHLFRSLRAYRQTMVLHHFDYKYSSRQMMKDAQGPRVDEKGCKRQLGTLVSFAKKAEKSSENYGIPGKSIPISAINFLESNGRTESGILNGNKAWLGSYSGCIRAKIAANLSQVYSESNERIGDIVGRYCVAHLKSRWWPKSDIYFDDRISIKVGLCLPDSCHSLAHSQDEAIRMDVDYLARYGLKEPFSSQRYFVDSLYCLPDEESPLRQWSLGAKVFAAICLIWATTLTLCSLSYGHRMRKKRNRTIDTICRIESNLEATDKSAAASCFLPNGAGQSNDAPKKLDGFDFVKAFSIMANLEHLCKINIGASDKLEPVKSFESKTSNGADARQMSIPLVAKIGSDHGHSSANNSNNKPANQMQSKREKRVNLDILAGIKVLGTYYVVMSHTLMLSMDFVVDPKFSEEKMLDFTMVAYIDGLQVVSMFYIITGILVTYLTFTRQNVRQLFKPTFWLVMIVGRYIRIIPVYFLVFLFAKYVASNTGSGAHWLDYRTDADHIRSYCSNESWLKMITVSATGVGPRQCLPQAWYLTNDLRFMFILPFYIILLALNKLAGYGAILMTFALTTWRYVSLLHKSGIDFSIFVHFKPHVFAITFEQMGGSYQDLLIRLSTCLLGVVVGHLLYLYETRQIEEWPRWLRFFGLKVASIQGALMFACIPLLGHPLVRQFLPPRNEINPSLVAWMFPILESGMQLSVCVAFLLMTTGGGFTTLNNLLSCRVAKFMSNISYAIFLIHIEVMYKFPGLKVENIYLFLLVTGIFFNVVSSFVAFFIHLLYEMPVNNITRYMMKRMIIKAVKR